MSFAKTPLPSWFVRSFTIVFAWSLIGMMGSVRTFTSLQARGIPTEWNDFFWPNMLSVWLWALFTPIIFGLSSVWRFESGSWQRVTPLHIGAGVTFAAADVMVDRIYHALLLGAQSLPFLQAFGFEFLINIFSYVGVVAIAHALSYYKLFRAQETRSLRLESKLAQARIQALRSHLHPHFLFNTINAAAELVHDDAEAADRMLTRLGQLLQRAFSESQLVQVPLERELSFARQYLDIAAIRFGDRVESVIDASPDANRSLVPSFLLQPLVENAIRHGVERAPGRVRVEITAAVQGDELSVQVSDTGPGLPSDTSRLEWRTGLEKVDGLLRELHADHFRLDLRPRDGGGTVAAIVIPFCPVEDSGAFRAKSPALEVSQ